MRKLLLICCCLCLAVFSYSQCNTGEIEVSIEVHTDTYANETYWELVPAGNSCGNGTIFAGGNTSVGCNGAGAQANPVGGYANSSEYTEGPWCLTEGNSYSIISIDDWGDGGPDYVVYIGGFPMEEFTTSGSSTTNTFTVELPPNLEAELHKIKTPAYVNKGSITVSGELKNNGATTITSMDVNYSINNGTTITSNINNLSIQPFDECEFDHPTAWTEDNTGQYSLKLWISNINGEVSDFDNTNNDQTKVINLKDPIPNIIPSYLSPSTTLEFKVIANSTDQVSTPTDLDFHPNGDLWIINRNTENTGGSTVKITNPNSQNPTILWQRDGNAWHFMSLPSAMAFSDNGNFGTTTSIFDANHSSTTSPFTGPSLWSSDPAIYAQPSGGNGSHFDMLHESPYCMGMAAYHDNAFWVFDKYNNDIVMYDFKADHGPGNDDHSDAIVLRYPEVNVDWIRQEVPSHLKYDKPTNNLYIVDGGNARILKMDVNSGTIGGTPTFGPFEPLAQYNNVTGVTYSELTSSGFTEACGIDVMTNYMIVSDYNNGDIIIYNNNSTPSEEVGRISTGSAGVTGVVIGPEGKIWYTNMLTNEVVKIEPSQIILSDQNIEITPKLSMYPNPTNNLINIDFNDVWNGSKNVLIYDSFGRLIKQFNTIDDRVTVDLSQYAKGFYYISVNDNKSSIKKRIILN